MRNSFVLILLLFYSFISFGQNIGQFEQPPIVLKRTKEKIKIDGFLREESWFNGQPAQNFWGHFPSDSIQASTQTEIHMMYDDNFLYIGAKCYSPGQNYIVPSLRRDFRSSGSDALTMFFRYF